MFLSNPSEILKRYKKERGVLKSIVAIVYYFYSQRWSVGFRNRLKATYCSISRSKAFRFCSYWAKKKTRQTLFKILKKELEGYYEKKRELHERILNELTERGLFDDLVIKSGRALIECKHSDSPNKGVITDWPPLNWTKKGLWKLRIGT